MVDIAPFLSFEGGGGVSVMPKVSRCVVSSELVYLELISSCLGSTLVLLQTCRYCVFVEVFVSYSFRMMTERLSAFKKNKK